MGRAFRLRKIVRRNLAFGCGNNLFQMSDRERLSSLPAVDRDAINADHFRKLVSVNLVAFHVICKLHVPFVRYPYKTCKRKCTIVDVYNAGRYADYWFMNRIRELRDARELTLAELGDAVGTTHATIQRLETGKMKLTEDWATKIAAALNVHVTEIFGDIVPASTQGLPVMGVVQAGVWREAEVADEPKFSPLPIGPDPRYYVKSQYALLVRGESMNRVVRDGAYIVCVSWADLGRSPRDNDLVVVERRRDGLVETTVKRIKFENKKVLLAPDSDDPRWQAPIVLDGGLESDEIVIAALVVGKYEAFS